VVDHINGSIPCASCGMNIHRGIVYELKDNTYVCDECYEDVEKLIVEPKDGLEQFDKY